MGSGSPVLRAGPSPQTPYFIETQTGTELRSRLLQHQAEPSPPGLPPLPSTRAQPPRSPPPPGRPRPPPRSRRPRLASPCGGRAGGERGRSPPQPASAAPLAKHREGTGGDSHTHRSLRAAPGLFRAEEWLSPVATEMSQAQTTNAAGGDGDCTRQAAGWGGKARGG